MEDNIIFIDKIEYFFKKTLRCVTVSECSKLLNELDEYNNNSQMFHKYPYTYTSLYAFICQQLHGCTPKESDIHKHFKEHHSKYIENSTIVKVKVDPKHKPDFFVSVNGTLAPVEIKLYDFDTIAKQQLQRYMFFYKTTIGFAVGRDLTTDLPENITFIQINPNEIEI